MPKKVKKDEKGPPEDVFESLLVESKQASTVVLMLDSPEEEVLSKACEAIYRFVEKCDENKKTLLDLNTLDPLLKLIHNEDRVVRRNACMALGMMAGHPDVRKSLRKREDTIPSMVGLLSPEEDTVVHEFSALCLSSLANDFSSKVTIFEQDGMEPLIRCLTSHDPDVQKNSLETISLMLQDYQSKSAIRELNGFPPILDLCRSEYPVVQHLALVALQRATEDPENRAMLRELEAINQLINFIGKPEWCDLHVFAVVVISNLLEDTESMEQIKENGGLQKLVAFITDTQPPEEEEKKGKKEKGASRAGKKGKGGADDALSAMGGQVSSMTSRMVNTRQTVTSRASSKASRSNTSMKKKTGFLPSSHLQMIPSASTEATSPSPMLWKTDTDSRDEKHKSSKGGDADPVIPTLPEVKEHASRAIARAAKNAENRKILHEQEAEKMLILLLGHEEPNVQVSAAQALGVMSENLLSRESIGQWEGIDPLIKMCKNDNPDVREAASMALANLTTANMNNSNEVQRLHGVDPLITMLSDTRELASSNAAIILTNMSLDEAMRTNIQNAGIISALIDPLKSNNTIVQSKAAMAIAAFCGDADARTMFRESGGIEQLVKLLNSGNDDVRRSSSWAISVCAVDEPTAVEISRHGGLELLQQVQLSSTRKNAFTDVAVAKLLDSNLSAKYALTGYLGPSNIIMDGFFDAGQLKAGSKFLSLEDYTKQDVNQKRPILLVNAKPEKPQTPAPQPSDPEITEKSSRSSLAGRSSKTGAAKAPPSPVDSEEYRKSRAQREREDKAREEAEASQAENEAGGFVALGDPNLMAYVEEVQERILVLPSTKDQVVALAQYVADKMGGAIDRGQIANFSWELSVSQLKFDLKTNVIPIGMLKQGIHYHRALLFKTLADRVVVQCSLVRGEYNRAWNEVMLSDDDDAPNIGRSNRRKPGAPQFPPKAYIVDLIHHPGRLMRKDSTDAVNYQKL